MSKKLICGLIILLISSIGLMECLPQPPLFATSSNTTNYVFRLKPNQNVMDELLSVVDTYNITAGIISTCVGSLLDAQIRFANQETVALLSGHFEIVSLVGTFSSFKIPNVKNYHLHISISDSNGSTYGGHFGYFFYLIFFFFFLYYFFFFILFFFFYKFFFFLVF